MALKAFSVLFVLFFSESVAFHWGPKPGLIRYYFQEGNRPNTKSDSLSFGIITPLENAVLLRIDSHSNNDYLEFEIVSVLLFCFVFTIKNQFRPNSLSKFLNRSGVEMSRL